MVIMASDASDDEGATPPEEMNRYGHVTTAAASSLLCISL